MISTLAAIKQIADMECPVCNGRPGVEGHWGRTGGPDACPVRMAREALRNVLTLEPTARDSKVSCEAHGYDYCPVCGGQS